MSTWIKNIELLDDETINLPALSSGAFGFISAGDDEEWALFRLNSSGTFSLVSYSANVVANAASPGTDAKLNLGIGTTNPATVKNSLGGPKETTITLWK